MARKPIIPQRIENDYSLKLRRVARIVGTLITQHTVLEKDDNGMITRVLLAEGLNTILSHYATSITPWAKSIATMMITQVNKSNEQNFLSMASHLSAKLKEEHAQSAIGAVARKIHEDQVKLITSLPLEAGQRAQKLAQEAMTGGRRASEVADMIMASGDVTVSRANTIARTEIHKSYAAFTQSRAQYVGSRSYQWATAGDEIVRESHAEMDGQIVNWDEEPTLSDGDTGHAGTFVNCRCFSIPIFNET